MCFFFYPPVFVPMHDLSTALHRNNSVNLIMNGKRLLISPNMDTATTANLRSIFNPSRFIKMLGLSVIRQQRVLHQSYNCPWSPHPAAMVTAYRPPLQPWITHYTIQPLARWKDDRTLIEAECVDMRTYVFFSNAWKVSSCYYWRKSAKEINKGFFVAVSCN